MAVLVACVIFVRVEYFILTYLLLISVMRSLYYADLVAIFLIFIMLPYYICSVAYAGDLNFVNDMKQGGGGRSGLMKTTWTK